MSRRSLLGMSVAVPLVSGVSAARLLRPEVSLRDRLATIPLPQGPAHLELVSYEETGDGPAALVRLYWPPGLRQRAFQSGLRDKAAAEDAIFAEIETYFTSLI